MKKLIMVLGILLLAGFIAYPIFAQQVYKMGKGSGMMGRGWGNGAYCGSGTQNWNNNLTKEQIQQIEDLNKKLQEQTQPTRTELRAKQAELFAAISAVKPDQNKALAVQKEISELQAKLAQEMIKFRLELRKIAPDAGFGRMGMMGGRQGRMGMMGARMGQCGGPYADDDDEN
jgi:Spy/CpxP family protein refolding chaperone